MSQRSSWGSNSPAKRKGYRVLRYWADTGDGKGYRRHTMTVEGGKRKGDEVLRDLWARHGGDRPTATMRIAYERWWLPDAQRKLDDGTLSKSTYDLYMSTWRVHIKPAWADRDIDTIRQSEVQEWLLTLSKWNASICKSLAAMVVRKAQMAERAGRNVFEMKYDMPTRGGTRTKAVWTLAEMGRAASAARGTALFVPVVLCGFGSCRVAESCAVLASEVELTVEHGMRVARIPIVRQLLRGGVSDTLKNPQSRRTVCIPEPWSVEIKEIAGRNVADGLMWLNDNGFGEPVSRAAIKSRWAGFRPDGLKPITMQNLRNSWETFMRWELGVEPDLVDSMMGHAGKSIRTRHYDRPAPDVYAETCALAHLGRLKRG